MLLEPGTNRTVSEFKMGAEAHRSSESESRGGGFADLQEVHKSELAY